MQPGTKRYATLVEGKSEEMHGASGANGSMGLDILEEDDFWTGPEHPYSQTGPAEKVKSRRWGLRRGLDPRTTDSSMPPDGERRTTVHQHPPQIFHQSPCLEEEELVSPSSYLFLTHFKGWLSCQVYK